MRALITGVTGQDGSYLAELLLEKGYEVHGMVRNIGRNNHERMSGVGRKISFVEADLTDQTALDRALQHVKPDEVYNLAGQTFVPFSWSQPLLTMEVTGMGALRMLEASPPEGYAACCAAVRDYDAREKLPAIRVPVLVIAGSQDSATPPADGRFIAGQIPGARYVELDAAHLSNIEASERFTAELIQFLSA